MKTAVDYLSEQLDIALNGITLNSKQHYLIVEAIRISKDLHKIEITKAFEAGYKSCDIDEAFEINRKLASGEQYYNQTFNK